MQRALQAYTHPVSDIVNELWAGLENNGFHIADSRHWKQHPDRDLTFLQRLAILLGEQIPPEHSKNVRLIMKGDVVAFLYVLSSNDKLFWGVSSSIIARLNQQPQATLKSKKAVPWGLVLLDGDWRTGFWFDSATVLKWRSRWRSRQGLQGEELVYYIGGNVTKCREDTIDATRFLGSITLLRLLNELLAISQAP